MTVVDSSWCFRIAFNITKPSWIRKSAHFVIQFTLNLTFICSKLVLQQATLCHWKRLHTKITYRKSLRSSIRSRITVDFRCFEAGFDNESTKSIKNLPSLLLSHKQNHFMHFMSVYQTSDFPIWAFSQCCCCCIGKYAINMYVCETNSLRDIQTQNSNLNCNCIKNRLSFIAWTKALPHTTHTHSSYIIQEYIFLRWHNCHWNGTNIFHEHWKTGVSFNDKTIFGLVSIFHFPFNENPKYNDLFRSIFGMRKQSIIFGYSKCNLSKRLELNPTHKWENECAKSIYLLYDFVSPIASWYSFESNKNWFNFQEMKNLISFIVETKVVSFSAWFHSNSSEIHIKCDLFHK